jgi:hypothetical protein
MIRPETPPPQPTRTRLNAVDLLCLCRFEHFQHVPDDVKRPVYVHILHLVQRNYQFGHLIQIFEKAFISNRWTYFVKIIYEIRKHIRKYPLCLPNVDTELILQLFEEEATPQGAHDILRSLLAFVVNIPRPDEHQQSAWNVGTNLLLNASSSEDKRAALVFLCAHIPSTRVV